MKKFLYAAFSDGVSTCIILVFLGGIVASFCGKSKCGTEKRQIFRFPNLQSGEEQMQKKKQKHFFSVFLLAAVLIPLFLLQTIQAAELRELVPVGKTVGVTMDTKGLLVLGTGSVDSEGNKTFEPGKGILKAGDMILKANGELLENKENFKEMVENSGGRPVTLLLERNGEQKEVKVTPVFSIADHAYKIGVWVRDSIQGIGTVTYYDPSNGTFGALGHGVYDVDTGDLMLIREGALVSSELTEIVKGQKGTAGELAGKVEPEKKLAEIEENTEMGIFGRTEHAFFDGKSVPIAAGTEVEKGEACMLSDLEGGEVKAYAIQIENISRNGGKMHKDMTIRITDERLLKLTGGIVQGTSGSPILQNGKLVGAVTHVMLNDPTRGYGIFVENMMEH